MTKNSTLGVVLTLILIVGGLLGLLGYKSIPDLFNNNVTQETSEPFVVKISPEYFSEGNYDYYDKIPFSIEINQKVGRNITYLELSKSNFKVSRDDKGLNKPSSQVNWKDSRSENILFFDYSNYYSTYSHTFPSSLKSEGEMSLCKNCFIGDSYPYVFTFTIYYKENAGELNSKTFELTVPIK